jgi:hypothetical protein
MTTRAPGAAAAPPQGLAMTAIRSVQPGSALAAGYLLAAPARLRLRLWHPGVAGAVMVAVSLSWIALYDVTPAASTGARIPRRLQSLSRSAHSSELSWNPSATRDSWPRCG